MKKNKLFILAAVILLLALSLCACSKDDKKKTDTNKPDPWTEINSPNMLDVYGKFLTGFTSVANEFTKSKLKNSSFVSTDGEFSISINKHTFYGSLKLNYDNLTPKDAMLSFELATKETPKPDDIVIGAYLYKEQLYLAIGDTTKCAIDFQNSYWGKYFPYELKNASTDDLAIGLNTTIVTSKPTTGKSRTVGIVTEYQYKLSINLTESLKNLFNSFPDMGKLGNIITQITGVTEEEVREGKFPKSTLNIDFTTSSGKISELKLDLAVDELKNYSGTVFGEDKLKFTLDLNKLQIGKSVVAVPFVQNATSDVLSQYVYYKDNAFQVTFDNTLYRKIKDKDDEGADNASGISTYSEIKLPDKGYQKGEYVTDIKAKVFQEQESDNYVFIEIKDKKTLKPVDALYVYHDVAYIYKDEGDEFKCKVSLPFNLTEIAYRTVRNDFGEENTKQIDWLELIGYVLNNLKVKNEGVDFYYDSEFYNNVWINMGAMLDFVNAKFEEDLLAVPAIDDFIDLTTKNPAIITLYYDKAFIQMLPNKSAELTTIINRLKDSQAELVFAEKENPEEEGENEK